MMGSKLLIRVATMASFAVCTFVAYAQVGTWQFKAHLSVPREDAAAATGQDGRIYVFGGDNTVPSVTYSTAEAYDPTTNSWSPIADMPDARRNQTAVAAPD